MRMRQASAALRAVTKTQLTQQSNPQHMQGTCCSRGLLCPHVGHKFPPLQLALESKIVVGCGILAGGFELKSAAPSLCWANAKASNDSCQSSSKDD
eukprot:6469253-Amphidinium_carterae.1